MTFYDVKTVTTNPNPGALTNIVTTEWGFVDFVVPQSLSTIYVKVLQTPVPVRAVNWRRFDPPVGAARQFSAGSYALGRRLTPLALEGRPFTINRPEFIINIPPPMIQMPWAQPPGNSGNVPTPTLVDRYWAVRFWLAVGVRLDILDEGRRWIWVRE